jgi:hypothetical protein
MTATGYITNPATADAVSAAVAAACDARGVARFIAVQGMSIFSGPHAGAVFIPLDDISLDQRLMHDRMRDYPEFQQLVASLGGLDARVEIDAQDLIDPSISEA